MTHGSVPQSGSLSARVIRACPTHAECPLDCPERQVEDLGEIARFHNRGFTQKIKEALWRRSAPTSAKQS